MWTCKYELYILETLAIPFQRTTKARGSRNPLENDTKTTLVVLSTDSLSLTRLLRLSRWLIVLTEFQTGLTEKRIHVARIDHFRERLSKLGQSSRILHGGDVVSTERALTSR